MHRIRKFVYNFLFVFSTSQPVSQSVGGEFKESKFDITISRKNVFWMRKDFFFWKNELGKPHLIPELKAFFLGSMISNALFGRRIRRIGFLVNSLDHLSAVVTHYINSRSISTFQKGILWHTFVWVFHVDKILCRKTSFRFEHCFRRQSIAFDNELMGNQLPHKHCWESKRKNGFSDWKVIHRRFDWNCKENAESLLRRFNLIRSRK